MTTKTKKTTGANVTKFTKAASPSISPKVTELAPIDNVTLNLAPETSRALMMIASSIMFSAPAFATQANPNNIISLGDLFYRFVKGEVTVNQPSDAVQNVPASPSNGTTFG